MARYGMVIDLDRCTGCRACMVACKIENNTPEGIFWMHTFRFEEGVFPNTRVWFLPRPCMHCDDPPCVNACPTEARFQREDGLVLNDFETCIGARYCQAACPYGVNYFNRQNPAESYYLDWDDPDLAEAMDGVVVPYENPDLEMTYGLENRIVAGGGHEQGVVEKCTFCVHRVDKGLPPACANVCPTKAIHFGDLDDPGSEVSKLLNGERSFRLQEQFGTNPKVFYIGGSPFGTEVRQIEKVGGAV